MAHAFKTISAKSTFGALQREFYQSDYINRKKKLACCRNNILPINKNNLIFGQYSKSNLYNVCTVSKGPPPSIPCGFNNCNPCQNSNNVIIDPNSTTPFYFNYTIDPLGELFGKTSCGILNYTNYMILNPPLKKI